MIYLLPERECHRLKAVPSTENRRISHRSSAVEDKKVGGDALCTLRIE